MKRIGLKKFIILIGRLLTLESNKAFLDHKIWNVVHYSRNENIFRDIQLSYETLIEYPEEVQAHQFVSGGCKLPRKLNKVRCTAIWFESHSAKCTHSLILPLYIPKRLESLTLCATSFCKYRANSQAARNNQDRFVLFKTQHVSCTKNFTSVYHIIVRI